MAISNNSTGLRPGVCTSTTRPTAPYEGQTIYETDTDLTYIWGGSAWQQVSGGTAVGNSGLVFVKSQTIGSGVASVTVTNAFSSTYDNYLIQVSGGSNSTNSVLTLRMDSVSSGYYFQYIYTVFGSNTVNADSSTTANGWIYAGSASTSGLAMSATVLSPNLAKMTRYFSGSNGEGVSYLGNSVGLLNNTTQYTGFTITNTGGGSMTDGTINVYGYRKA